VLSIIIIALLNVLTPWHDWHINVERQQFEGDRWLDICVWRYQKPETMMTLELRFK
jgi:hypothetical protein